MQFATFYNIIHIEKDDLIFRRNIIYPIIVRSNPQLNGQYHEKISKKCISVNPVVHALHHYPDDVHLLPVVPVHGDLPAVCLVQLPLKHALLCLVGPGSYPHGWISGKMVQMGWYRNMEKLFKCRKWLS